MEYVPRYSFKITMEVSSATQKNKKLSYSDAQVIKKEKEAGRKHRREDC